MDVIDQLWSQGINDFFSALINVSRGISFAGDMSKNRIRFEAKKYIEKMEDILGG